MQSKQNILKNAIIILILLVIAGGIYFGITFYQASKNIQSGKTSAQNKNINKTPFQTRVASGSDVTLIEDNTPEDVENPMIQKLAPMSEPQLVQLWKEPVSGFDFVYKDIATTTDTASSTQPKKIILKNQTFIYLWDRSTGNIYENIASSSKTDRISNYTLPKIEEAYFIDPLTVFVRGVSENNESIRSSHLQLFKETATSTFFTTKEKYVPLYSKNISILRDTKKMFYFIEKTGQAFVSNLDVSSSLNVLKTTVTQWLPQYVNKTTLSITTRPSAYFPGYMFFVNSIGSQENQYIIGDKYGFTTLVSPDGKKVLYSYIENNTLQTSIYDIKTKKNITLSQSTLSEKCTWASNSTYVYCAIPQKLAPAAYPDAWYQGLTSFTDNIWSVEAATGLFTIQIPLQDQVTTPIDAYNLKLSSDSKYILFQDKNNLTLWKYSF